MDRAACYLRGAQMRQIYNILFIIGFVLSAPFYFLKMWRRGNWTRGFGERFAQYGSRTKLALTNRHSIWLHAVSVGEVNLCVQLVRALEQRLPHVKLVVSTTTSTGMGELQKKLPAHVEKIYYPVDRRKFVRRALNVIHPDVIVLVEAEIWPNFLWRAADAGIPVLLVNARLSPRSLRGYKRFHFLFQPIFAQFAGIGAQHEPDAEKLKELGCRPEAIRIIGNLKFDAAQSNEPRRLDVAQIFRQLNVPEDAQVLLGSSTHDGEEKILADIFLRLKKTFPKLFLVLVPRHFERGKDVARQLEAAKVPYIFRTDLQVGDPPLRKNVDCLLVNTTGELRFFYQRANVVFVGKSLTAEGGQSPIEAGAQAKAMIFGPNMQNFTSIAEEFLSAGGAVQVRDAAELEKSISELLQNSQRREELGKSAEAVVKRNTGAVDRTVEMILEKLPPEIYVQPPAKK